jgi:O-antigen ligase
VAIAIIPLALWLARFGTIFPPDWKVKTFAWALSFASVLIPVGTAARTGLLCLGALVSMALRTARRRVLYTLLIAGVGLVAVPFLPPSFTTRMETIANHSADQSASTRLAVWAWTLDYAKEHPFGGGFEAYRQNRLSIDMVETQASGNTTATEVATVTDRGRAYHSSYFEMLGEQGWPGLALWLLLHGLGVWQMEVLRRRFRREAAEGQEWIGPLAQALLQAQVVYLVGSLFVGIAFQPFCYMVVALQCALWSMAQRLRQPRTVAVPLARRRPRAPAVPA